MAAMSTILSPQDRRRLAEAHCIHEQYLYQCLTGRRDMSPVEARRIEADSGGELTRQMLCTKTWMHIWPELVGADAARETQSESARATPEPNDWPPLEERRIEPRATNKQEA